jgi:hypothetical protein
MATRRPDLANITMSDADRILVTNADFFTGFRRRIPSAPKRPVPPQPPRPGMARNQRPVPVPVMPVIRPRPTPQTVTVLPPGIIYDMPLPIEILEALPESLRDAKTFSDLAKIDGGLRWWADFGMAMFFRRTG